MNKRVSFGIFLAYFALSIAMMHPVFEAPTHRVYGVIGDNIGTVSSIWALQKIGAGEADPEVFDYGNYPDGFDIGKTVHMYTSDALIWIFARTIPDPLLAFNLLVAFKFSLAAFTMFLLLFHLTNSLFVAIIFGIFYAFCPYFTPMAKAYGPNFISAFLPLLVHQTIRFLASMNVRTLGSTIVAFILFFGEQFYYSYFFAVVLFLSTPFFLAAYHRQLRTWLSLVFEKRRTMSKRSVFIVLSAIMTIALGGGLLGNYIHNHFSDRLFTFREAGLRASDPYFLFRPSVGNSILGKAYSDAMQAEAAHLEIYELANYIGYVPLALIVLAWCRRRSLSVKEVQALKFFTILIPVAISLELGFRPIRWHYQSFADMEGPAVLAFALAPMFRFIARYHIVTIFSVVAASGIGMQALLHCFRYRFVNWLLVAAASTVIALEYANFTIQQSVNIFEKMPTAYKDLAKIPGSDAIVDFPSDNIPLRFHHLAFQIFHNKKMSGTIMEPIEEDIFDWPAQEKYLDRGIKYVVVTAKMSGVRERPLQAPFDDLKLLHLPTEKKSGHLKLLASYDDSRLYELTRKETDDSSVDSAEFQADGKQIADASCDAEMTDKFKTSPRSATLAAFTATMMAAVKAGDRKRLESMFDPALSMNRDRIVEYLQELSLYVGVAKDVRLLSTFHITSPLGLSRPIYCPKNSLFIRPIFGFPSQVAQQIEVLGPVSTAQIYVAMVPRGDSWAIRAWKSQPWSQGGKDAAAWFEQAESLAKRGIPYAAYLYFMFAESLAPDNTYISSSILGQKIIRSRTSFYPPQLMSDFGLVVFGEHSTKISPFGFGHGIGIEVQLVYPVRPPRSRMAKICESYVPKFLPAPDGKALNGIRCVFMTMRNSREPIRSDNLIELAFWPPCGPTGSPGIQCSSRL